MELKGKKREQRNFTGETTAVDDGEMARKNVKMAVKQGLIEKTRRTRK